MRTLAFQDMFDLSLLSDLLNKFEHSCGVPILVVDPDNNLLGESSYNRLCDQFHHKHPETKKKCMLFDGNNRFESIGNDHELCKCGNNFWHIVFPLLLEDHPIAMFFVGPFLIEEEDRSFDRFKAWAKRFDFDESDYLSTLQSVPVVPRSQIEQLRNTFHLITQSILTIGKTNLKLKRKIDQHQQVQDKLKANEKRFRTIYELLPVGYQSLDEEGRYLEVNQKWLTQFGYRREEVIGKWFGDFLPDDHKIMFKQGFENIKSGCQISNVQYQFFRKDGVLADIILNGVIETDSNGNFKRTHCELHDISQHIAIEKERKQVETRLEEAKRLESLSQLAGGVAHDFNNLLTGVIGNVNMAMDDLPANSNIQKYLTEIEGAARKAALLSQKMLAYSGKIHILLEPIRLSEYIHANIGEIQSLIPDNIKLIVDLEASLPSIHGAQEQIQQMVQALVSNAAEAFEGKQGKIRLKTGFEQLTSIPEEKTYGIPDPPAGDYVYLQIQDDGVGMSGEVQAKLFDPFFTTKFTGRGLGMSAVLGIVRGHNGFLKIHSKPQLGTTIQVWLPVKDSSRKQSESTEATVPPSQEPSHDLQPTILVVDDEPVILRMTERALRMSGYTSITAGNGHDALEIYRKLDGKIQLVVLDLAMPDMDGAEVFSRIREMNPSAKVLMISGYDITNASNTLESQYLAGFLQKPFGPSKLLSKIDEILDTPPQWPTSNN